MSRPRVLFLSQVLPYPLDSGPKVRAYHVLRWLSEHADVDLATFVRSDDPESAIDHLRSFCHAVHTVPMKRSRLKDAYHFARTLFSDAPLVVERDTVRGMQATIRDLGKSGPYAICHADQLWMAQYGRMAASRYRVLDNHNAVFMIFKRLAASAGAWPKRWLFEREARRLADYEVAQLDAFDRVLFVTNQDRQAVIDMAPQTARRRLGERTEVLPICVDASSVRPIEVSPEPWRLTVLGTLYWPPNAEGVMWMAEHVLPRVLTTYPQVRLTLIGKNPPPAVRALADRFPDAVEITGYVADPRPFLAETAAFLVPLFAGAGMRVKILDAWAWGLPVVSTSIGAEGIRIRPGGDILIADTPDTFAGAINRLLGDGALRTALGRAGRQTLDEHYDVRQVYGKLAGVYGAALD